MLEFAGEGVNLRKSAVFCENLRFGLSLSPQVRHLKRALRVDSEGAFSPLSAPSRRIAIRWRFFTADEEWQGISAVGIILAHLNRIKDRSLRAIFDRREIATSRPSNSIKDESIT